MRFIKIFPPAHKEMFCLERKKNFQEKSQKAMDIIIFSVL